jgi:hypothetical protein
LHKSEFGASLPKPYHAATALIPYQSPRLTAIAPPRSAAVEQRKHVTISIDIFNDKGEPVDHSEQRNVRRDDLPLLIALAPTISAAAWRIAAIPLHVGCLDGIAADLARPKTT